MVYNILTQPLSLNVEQNLNSTKAQQSENVTRTKTNTNEPIIMTKMAQPTTIPTETNSEHEITKTNELVVISTGIQPQTITKPPAIEKTSNKSCCIVL